MASVGFSVEAQLTNPPQLIESASWLEEEAKELEGLAELFNLITNVCNALSGLAFLSLAVGSLWWSNNHHCARIWLGWFVVGCTLIVGGLGETWQAQGSRDATAVWLMKSLQFQGGERSDSQVERLAQQCRNGWGAFNLGVITLSLTHL